MAWVERHRTLYRVRDRNDGRLFVDSTYPTEEQAVARAVQIRLGDRAVRRQLIRDRVPTLRQWVAEWLPAHTAGRATMAKYETLLRVHILPAFGDARVDAITRNAVKAFAKSLGERRSPATVRTVVTLLGLVLREAIDEHYLLFDPTARLRLRDGLAEPRPVATPFQIWQIAQRMPSRIPRALVITAAYTGMRFGELAGLSRTNVHLDRTYIHVSGNSGALHEVNGQRWLGPPKTKASIRDVHLPPFLAEGLRRLLDSHPFDTVFCTDTGNWLWRTTFVQRTWRPACDGDPKRHWEPIIKGFRFHDTRHAHRTWMDEDGIPEALKCQRLGHQLIGIRGIYAHVTEPMQPPLLAALERRWYYSGGYW